MRARQHCRGRASFYHFRILPIRQASPRRARSGQRRMCPRKVLEVQLGFVLTDHCSVDHDVSHARGLLIGQPLAIGRQVPQSLLGSGGHRVRIEHAHVGVMTFAEVTAPLETEHIGGLAR